MEKLGIQTGPLIAQIVNFGLIVLVFKFFLLKPIQNLLAERKAKIEQSLKDADAIEERLKKVEKEIDQKLSKASGQADEVIAQSKKAGEELREQIKKHAEQEADAILKKAQAAISRQQEESLVKLEGKVADLAKSIAEKILSGYLTQSDSQKITERALKDVTSQLQ